MLHYNSRKTIKHLLLIIFCKTTFILSYTTVGPDNNISIHLHWIDQQAANRNMPYIELLQDDNNVGLPVYHKRQKYHSEKS